MIVIGTTISFGTKEKYVPQKKKKKKSKKVIIIFLNLAVSAKCQRSHPFHTTTIAECQGSHFKYCVASQHPISHYVHKRKWNDLPYSITGEELTESLYYSGGFVARLLGCGAPLPPLPARLNFVSFFRGESGRINTRYRRSVPYPTGHRGSVLLWHINTSRKWGRDRYRNQNWLVIINYAEMLELVSDRDRN